MHLFKDVKKDLLLFVATLVALSVTAMPSSPRDTGMNALFSVLILGILSFPLGMIPTVIIFALAGYLGNRSPRVLTGSWYVYVAFQIFIAYWQWFVFAGRKVRLVEFRRYFMSGVFIVSLLPLVLLLWMLSAR